MKLSDIQYFVQRRKARKREGNNDTFTYTYKKTNDIFIMQIVAYFFIFIERFTQSYEHNLALPVGKSQVNMYTHLSHSWGKRQGKKKVRQKCEWKEKWGKVT